MVESPKIFDEEQLDITAEEVNELLKKGNPAIYTPQVDNQITINPQCLGVFVNLSD